MEKFNLYLLGIVFFSVLCVTSILPVSGDGGDPNGEPHLIDVQGAKVVSEGAYFYFEVTNLFNETIEVKVSYLSVFEFDGDLPISFGGGGHGGGSVASTYGICECEINFTLDQKDHRFLHFHAPYIKDEATGYSFRFDYTDGNILDSRVYFSVVVVDKNKAIEIFEGWRGITFQELWTRAYESERQVNILEKETRELTTLSLNLTLISIFVPTVLSVLLSIEYKRRKILERRN